MDKAELALCGLADVVDMFGPGQFGCKVTPRYLTEETTGMGLLSTQSWRGMGWVERVTGRTFDLAGFRARPWSLAH